MRKNLPIIVVLISSLFLFQKTIVAQVVINEFSSVASSSSDPDWPDWIELYNDSEGEVDLQGWLIKDVTGSSDTATAFEFAGSVIIPPQGFYVQEISNRLNKNGDRILLFQGETQKDCVAYGDGKGVFCGETKAICVPSENQSIGRLPDGTGSFVRFSSQTKESENVASREPCPTPTSVPQPTPTKTPKPTNTPKPTKVLTKTPTPKQKTITGAARPTIKIDDKDEFDSTKEGEFVLGLRDKIAKSENEAKEENTGEEATEGKFPMAAGFFIAGGLVFLGAAAYPFLKNRNKGYNSRGKGISKNEEDLDKEEAF